MTYLSFSEYSILWECEEHVRLHGGRLTGGEENPGASATEDVHTPGASLPVSRPLPIHARGKAPKWNPPQRVEKPRERLPEARMRELLG